jgi:multiple sugar transport system ATP-binding protein
MARATLRDVGKRFGDVVALADFSLDASDGELVTILGPSGCGKSTVLRLIAGLDEPTEGTIHLDERRIDGLAPHERDVAMVFQSYALYPHMTVRGNIEFPLRMRRVARDERRKRAREVAELLELHELLDRRPAALSGGQRQRVALARALVRHPALFLLDEPLSNLDARLRTSLRQHLRDIQRRLGVTTLYVTHDQTEAMTLGDRIVILDRGRIQQVDTPLALYERPANTFVAGFVGTPPMNLLHGETADGVLRLGDQTIELPRALRAAAGTERRQVIAGIRPESFARVDGDRRSGVVSAVPDASTRELLGGEMLVRASLGDGEAIIRLFGAGHDVPARVEAGVEALHLFDAESGARLGS